MKIGLDARMYGPSQGGLGRYVEQLILHLERIDQTNDYVILLRAENFDAYQPKNPRFKKVLADIHWYGLAEQTYLPGIIKKEKVDLMHWPHWNVPFFYHGPFVVTIHDLILLHYPARRASTLGPLAYYFKHLAWRLVLNRAITKAKKIITPSEFTKNDLIKTLGVPADKITVTHLAPFQKSEIKNQNSDFLIKKQITKPYLLYVGVAYPHKNLVTLLAAWKIFQVKYPTYQLVLAGKENYFYHRLKNLAQTENISGVIFTDFVPEQELPGLYTKSVLYVFPSLYEGFGLPPLEAMQYGVPVASSSAACLPEILDDAAIYFDPVSPANMAEAFERAIFDQNLRQKLAENALKTLSLYQWKKTAENTLSVYENSV